MKFLAFAALFCCTFLNPENGVGQDTLFMDSNWIKTQKKTARYWGSCDTAFCRFYYFTGELAGDFQMKNKLRHGPSLIYYRNGQVSLRSLFFHGRPTGRMVGWYPSGKLKEESEYVPDFYKMISFYDSTGKQTVVDGSGEAVSYYENRKLLSKGSYLDGMRHGAWIFCNENGDFSMGNYAQNKMEGEWKIGDSTGRVTYSYFFKNNETKEGIKYMLSGEQIPFFPKYHARKGKIINYRLSRFAIEGKIGGTQWLYASDSKRYFGNHGGPSFRISVFYKNAFLSLGFRPATVNPKDTLFVSPAKLYNTADLNIVKTDISLGYSFALPFRFSIDPFVGYTTSSFPVINEDKLGAVYDLRTSIGVTFGAFLNKYIQVKSGNYLIIYLLPTYSYSNYKEVYNSLGKSFGAIEAGLGYRGTILRKLK